MLKNKWNFLVILSVLLFFGILNFDTVFAQDNNVPTERISGNNRYETSIAISKAGWVQASTVIIASGLDYADALSAAALSKSKDAPILLTAKTTLEPITIDEIKRLKTTQAFLIGGTGVIATSVEKQLTDIGIVIIRIGGNDRYDTSKKVAEIVGVSNGIIMASDSGFADSLSIATIASIKSIPILISPQNSINPQIATFLKDRVIPVSYIVGGPGVLGTSIDSSLLNSKRLSGLDRYLTNLSINNEFADDFNFDTVYLASGNDFPDALGGAALAAKNNAPIFLTDKNSVSVGDINFFISKNVRHVVILGGLGVISASVDNTVKTAINSIIVHPDSVSLNKTKSSLIIGSTDFLTATVTPSTVSNKTLSWKSSSDSIATVDNTGKVTAISAGGAIITAITTDGSKIATCSVIVNGKKTTIFAIDIGHNANYDTGAVGIRAESACTKAVGTLVISKLKTLGYRVIDCSPSNATSTTNSLQQRCDIANAAHADYFMSIHFNIFDKAASGSEVFISSSTIKPKAQQVVSNLASLGYINRGVNDNSRNLYVLSNTNMPSMLVECAFLDSVSDMNKYDPDKIADALVNGLIIGN